MWRDADSKSITNPSAKTSASSHFYYKPSKNSTIEELEEKQINQLSVNLPIMVIIHSFISVTVPKPHRIKNPSPTQIIMFSFGQFLQQKWAQNIRHLYVINHLFLTFRARISKMSSRQFEAFVIYIKRIRRKQNQIFCKLLYTPFPCLFI